MRSTLALVLAVLVALSSVTMAGARHQERAAGQVTLCTGLGMVAVAIDQQGNPVGPMLPCPDCIVASVAVAPGAPVPTRPPLRLSRAEPVPQTRAAPLLDAPGFHWSRGPPAQA